MKKTIVTLGFILLSFYLISNYIVTVCVFDYTVTFSFLSIG